MFKSTLLFLLLGATVAFAQLRPATDLNELQRTFQNPPDNAKIMMRWWWFGPAVTKTEIEREMRAMKAGGIGGFEVQAVYPVALDDESKGIKTLPFLSAEFIDALKFTADKARELGLRMDLTVGSGWPYGGAQVPITQAAGRLRVERVRVQNNQRRIPLPGISEGEKLLAVFLVQRQDQAAAAESFHEITDLKDGAAWLPSGSNDQAEVMFFISSRTGMQVKRAGVGAEGFVLDHYDRNAIDSYLKNVGEPLIKAFGAHPPAAIFCDSLEVFNSDWTPDFLSEFQKRRGYDLRPLLPALSVEMGPKTAAIRHDWGQTLTELLNERFLMPVHEWAQRHQTKFRIQNYGIPPATISSNAYNDLSEGEGPQWKVLRASRWASSANHLYGRNVTSSETWTWLHSPSFRATPLDMKAEADLHFLQGINQLIGHGWPYTAEGVEYPGWRFYASAVFNDKNPWWIVMPDITQYLQRMSWLLRQGQPANDIAFYLPNNDAWAGFTNGKLHYMIEALKDRIGDDVIARTLEAGYNLDFFDDEVLGKIGQVEKGALTLGANKYKAVLLPNVERIPLATLKKLDEFARQGGIVIATRRLPSVAPGYKATDAEQNEISAISQRLFGGSNATAQFVKNEAAELGGKLNSLLKPDVALIPAVPEIGFIHRRTENADIYFLVNSSNVRHTVNATFRAQATQAELWNPFDGSVVSIVMQANADGTVTVPLEFEPYGSRVIILTNRVLAKAPTRQSSAPPAPLDLSNGWSVSFGDNSAPVLMNNKLRSWTEDEATRYFSGVAIYQKAVTVTGEMLKDGLELHLDFGEGQAIPSLDLKAGMQAWLDAPIRDAAVIYINDKRAGSVWCPPYSLNVTGLLQRGENRIRILVANTAINFMAGRKLPDYKLLNLRYGVRFENQDMDKVQPQLSGILGNIRLIAR